AVRPIWPSRGDRGTSLPPPALALSAYGVGSVSGRLLSGAVSDRLGAHTTLRIGFALQIVALAALLWLPSQELLMLGLGLFGAGFAAADTMITRIIPDVFGLRAIGGIM